MHVRRLATVLAMMLLCPARAPASSSRVNDAQPVGFFRKAVHQLHLDRAPRTWDGVKAEIRRVTAEAAPESTAAQRREWGLLLPQKVDPVRPLVVVIPGLDAEPDYLAPMVRMLGGHGWQVATFGYPNDGPVADASDLLARHLKALHEAYPALRIDVVAHSLGGVVARDYVEGSSYAGGVDRLILLAPPNHGSAWAKWSILAKFDEHGHLCCEDPGWSPTWAVTDGLGEAGRDLRPGSRFLAALNARPRRPTIRYTIVAGNQTYTSRIEADAADAGADLIPAAPRWLAPLGRFRANLARKADDLRSRTGDSDGPVTLDSARLDGVADFVVVPADHTSIYYPCDDCLPPGWAVVEDRLEH